MPVEILKRHSDGCGYKPRGQHRSAPMPFHTSGNEIPLNIFVKMASPAKTIMLIINAEDTVRTLKLRIQEKEGVDANRMDLHFKSKTCKDDDKLSQYGVKNSDVFWISRHYDGGA